MGMLDGKGKAAVRAGVKCIGGTRKPSRITTWQAYRQFGLLTISLDRRSADGKFRVHFTHVAVKLAGSDQWIEGR